MGLKEILIPQEKVFFDLLEKQARMVVEGAKALSDLISGVGNDTAARRKTLKDIEHKGDDVVHEIYGRLNKSFITPIDQEDISALTKLLDDILDFMFAAGNRLYLYDIKKSSEAMRHFTDVILKAALEIDAAIALLRKMDRGAMEKRFIEIHRLENIGDDLLNNSVAELFKSTDPINIMKLKEIYEILETVTDRCEDVSDVLMDISMKYG